MHTRHALRDATVATNRCTGNVLVMRRRQRISSVSLRLFFLNNLMQQFVLLYDEACVLQFCTSFSMHTIYVVIDCVSEIYPYIHTSIDISNLILTLTHANIRCECMFMRAPFDDLDAACCYYCHCCSCSC